MWLDAVGTRSMAGRRQATRHDDVLVAVRTTGSAATSSTESSSEPTIAAEIERHGEVSVFPAPMLFYARTRLEIEQSAALRHQ